MKKLGKKVLASALILSLAAGLSACTTYTNFKNAFFGDKKVATERTIKIGVFEPMSGKNKTEGNEEVMGIELAHDLYPEVCGKKVELVYGDNKSDIYTGETVIQELISANSPSVILGSYGETLTLIAGKYAKANNIPAITISSTNPLVTANNEYYFSATYSETRQGDALADFAYTSQKLEKVAAVKADSDDSAIATIKRFTNRFKNLTGNTGGVTANLTLPKDSSDYSSIIQALRSSGAQAVFLAVSPSIATDFMKQAKKAGLTNVLYLGTRAWNDDAFIKFLQKNPQFEVAFPTEEGQNSETATSETFLNAYKSFYGENAEPSERTAVAFDAYCLALDAIKRAYAEVQAEDSDKIIANAATEAEGRAAKEAWQTAMDTGIPTGTQIRKALSETTNFQGASGVINYAGKNEATKSITISHYKAGRELAAYTVE